MSYGIPIMFDVDAESREHAGRAIVALLAEANLVGQVYDGDMNRDAVIESWWTIEAEDKHADGNDNAIGEVLFDGED